MSPGGAQQALRDSEARFRAVFETAVDGIITIDERGVIETVNPAVERLFGYAPVEIIGHNVSMLMPRPDSTRHDQYLRNYIETGLRQIIGIGREVTGMRKDGSLFAMDLAVSEFWIGQRRMFAGIIHDVSDRKRVAEERERSLKIEREARAIAERASKAKDEFLAVLSHELRTPLAPVMLAASELESSPALPPDLVEIASTIRRNVELEARLIDDLLDLTRVATGRLALNPRPSDLHTLVQAAMVICRRDNGPSVTAEFDAARHIASADPARFQQVVWNLLNNAQKFTPPTGHIHVRTENPSPDVFRLTVRDDGAGIDPQFLPRIFRAFEQGDRRRARQFGGLGLGLAISKAIAESHGGTVCVHSDGVGLGAQFTVDWPVTAAQSPREEPTAPKPVHEVESSAPLRILLVEDHQATLQIMRRLLSRFGHQVTGVASVQDAVEAAQATPFDLLITDLGLPDGSGIDVLREMMRLKPQPIAAIAVSGFGTPDDLSRTSKAGFQRHLVKPIDVAQLVQAIADVREYCPKP